MDISLLKQIDDCAWRINRHGAMHVPAIIYASKTLAEAMDHKVYEQLVNVASLPGIVSAAMAMPDAHWGYGFPIGGVAAFDAGAGGVISAGGVGFDISCGVRTLITGIAASEIEAAGKQLADALYVHIPAGLGSKSRIHLGHHDMDAMLAGGARWAVEQGYGDTEDLERCEEKGCMPDAQPEAVSAHARQRQQDEMGTLGSGNHYLEVQRVAEIHDTETAAAYGLKAGEVVVSIHCGSRGLGHQIGTEFLRQMVTEAATHGIRLPDRELACAPIASATGQAYLGAMRAAINCALANRQILTHFARQAFDTVLPGSELRLLYDVSHNTCKQETHRVNGRKRALFVHRKGATRAFGPGHPALPVAFSAHGQPVLIGGTMGTASYVLAGCRNGLAFHSACHGAGRAMSRHKAKRHWHGASVIKELAGRGIEIRSRSLRGVAEEAPGAYKDVTAVVDATEQAGLARKVARLVPLICIKG